MLHGSSKVEPLVAGDSKLVEVSTSTNVSSSSSTASSTAQLTAATTLTAIEASNQSNESKRFARKLGFTAADSKAPTKLDPNLRRLLTFLGVFGLWLKIDLDKDKDKPLMIGSGSNQRSWRTIFKVLATGLVGLVTGDVIYGINLRQSKLVAEQKRSTPLLTFVIVAYCWLSLVAPYICDLYLLVNGSRLFRFYNKTTTKVCNGCFFGKSSSVDKWYFYLLLVLLAGADAAGQTVVLGVWPPAVSAYYQQLSAIQIPGLQVSLENGERINLFQVALPVANLSAVSSLSPHDRKQPHSAVAEALHHHTLHGINNDDSYHRHSAIAAVEEPPLVKEEPQIQALIIDTLLGDKYAHNNLGVTLKMFCLMIQFMHLFAFTLIVMSFSNHFACVINEMNSNLDNYEFKRLLKQLIILHDASEKMSFMVSPPFALIIFYTFMRLIALCGVYIQSTMQPYENFALGLQIATSCIMTYMAFACGDDLQSASKQTHRLKIEQIVVTKNKVVQQSLYELLEYLNRLTKSIRITFFDIFGINKGSLVGFFGHILTLTFVTS